jgi:hypothetical protein
MSKLWHAADGALEVCGSAESAIPVLQACRDLQSNWALVRLVRYGVPVSGAIMRSAKRRWMKPIPQGRGDSASIGVVKPWMPPVENGSFDITAPRPGSIQDVTANQIGHHVDASLAIEADVVPSGEHASLPHKWLIETLQSGFGRAACRRLTLKKFCARFMYRRDAFSIGGVLCACYCFLETSDRACRYVLSSLS